MPFKSQAQRRKFAELLVQGKISNQTFEEWNREDRRPKASRTSKEEEKDQRANGSGRRDSALCDARGDRAGAPGGALGFPPLDDWHAATRAGLCVMFLFTGAAHFTADAQRSRAHGAAAVAKSRALVTLPALPKSPARSA